jgi:peptidyl-prolyl cis-trans isomerase SurA
VRSKLITGSIDFGTAVSKYSDDEDKFSGGWMAGRDGSTFVTIDQLDKEMIPVIKNMKPGEYSQPTTYVTEQGKKGVRLIYLRNRTTPHVKILRTTITVFHKGLLRRKNKTSWPGGFLIKSKDIISM